MDDNWDPMYSSDVVQCLIIKQLEVWVHYNLMSNDANIWPIGYQVDINDGQ